MTDPDTPSPAPETASTGQTSPKEPPEAIPAGGGTSPTGRREAFRDLGRRLTNEDLASPGVQRLLLDECDRSQAEIEVLTGYRDRFHDVDKEAAVLREQVRAVTAIEIMFGAGVALGGAIMGLAPLFWENQPRGILVLAVGFLLILGAVIGRIVKK